MRVGDIRDSSNSMGAVIDKSAFKDHVGYIEHAKNRRHLRRHGRQLHPTQPGGDAGPQEQAMREEISGPVLTWHMYDANDVDGAVGLCDETSLHALPVAVFARDRAFIERASQRLRHAAGNFYINDKPAGAVVGQQPFG